MTIKTDAPFSWLRQIPGELYQLDEKPLIGFPPEFSWSEFSKVIEQSIQIKNLSITLIKTQWLSKNDVFNEIGEHLKIISLSVAPFSGKIWWALPEQHLQRIMSLILNKESPSLNDSMDEAFSDAFYQFIIAEALQAFEKVVVDKKLTPIVLKESTNPLEPCLGIDISIAIENHFFFGKLYVSEEFRKSWREYHWKEKNRLTLASPIAEALDVVINLEAGKITLMPSEWKQVSAGDYIILDHCSLEPDEDKGRVMLVINGTPFFRAKIKDGSLKILEHPLYHEVETPMANTPKNSDEENHDEDLSDADFDFDEDEEEDFKENKEDDFDIDLDEEKIPDENLKEQELAKDKKPSSSSSIPAKNEDKSETSIKTTISNTTLTIDEIPLIIVVEVGRLQMSVKKLLELQPGNMLDLEIHPEAGIDMVVNGKRIARGELLKIGDSLGIRILELS